MIPPWRSTIQVESCAFFAFHLLRLSISPVYFWIEGLRQDWCDPAKIDDTALEIHNSSRVLRFFCFPSPQAFHLTSILLDRRVKAGSMGPGKEEKISCVAGFQWRTSLCWPLDHWGSHYWSVLANIYLYKSLGPRKKNPQKQQRKSHRNNLFWLFF